MTSKSKTGSRKLISRKKNTSCPILHTSVKVLSTPGIKSPESYVVDQTQLKAASGFIREESVASYPLANASKVVVSASSGAVMTVVGKSSAITCRRGAKKVRNCRSLNIGHRVQMKHFSQSRDEGIKTKLSIREYDGGQGYLEVKEKRKRLVERKCKPVEYDHRESSSSQDQVESSQQGLSCTVRTSSRLNKEISRDKGLNVKQGSKSNRVDFHLERGRNSKSTTKMSAIKSLQQVSAHKRALHNAHSTHKKLPHQNTTSPLYFGDKSSTRTFQVKRSKSDLKEMSRKVSHAHLMSSTQKGNDVSSTLHLDKSDPKTRHRNVHQGGVVRTTRIVRKNKTSNALGGCAPRAGKNSFSLLPVNPCDDGKLGSSKTGQEFGDIRNRWDGDRSDDRPSNKDVGGLHDVTLSNTLPTSMTADAEFSSTTSPEDHGTCSVDQRKRLKRISKYNTGVDGTNHTHVHVTRIRKKVTTAARNPCNDINNNSNNRSSNSSNNNSNKCSNKINSNNNINNNINNNADHEPDDNDEVETKTSKSSSNDRRSSSSSKSSTLKETGDSVSRSSESTSHESEDKVTIPEVSSPIVSKKTPDKSRSAKFQPQPVAQTKTKKKTKRSVKEKESRTKRLMEIEAAENTKSPVPPCPLFQGWDYDRDLGVHNMDRLPLESDLAAQLSKIVKRKIWEARGRPQNVSSMLRCSLPSTSLVTEDLKTYMARHSIEQFIQHLTHSVMLVPRGQDVLETLIDQCRSFKEKLKFDIETDEFLKFVFSRLGSKPIAFPSATKTRSIDMAPEDQDETISETPRSRRSYKRSIDIVIGMPGAIYEPRMSARSDIEKSNTLQIWNIDPFHRDSSIKSSSE